MWQALCQVIPEFAGLSSLVSDGFHESNVSIAFMQRLYRALASPLLQIAGQVIVE